MSMFHALARFGALATGLAALAAPVAAQVMRVENTATLAYRTPTGEAIVRSNTVSTDVDRAKRPTTLSFRLLPPGYTLSGMTCVTEPTVRFTPAPIDEATFDAAPEAEALDITTPIIIVLDADNDNRDPDTRETLNIDVDTGRIKTKLPLLETGPDTGVFAGGVPAASDKSDPALAPCNLNLKRGDRLTLSFTENDFSLASTASILVDPAGYVFDSATGELVDGATVTLLDAAGNPAEVYGDDGDTRYPSTVVTGQPVTDAAGRVYAAVKGRYRFPLAAPGQYQIRVVPPAPYTAPSVADRNQVAQLKDPAGDPFILVEASYGGFLTLAGMDPIFADIPVDKPTALNDVPAGQTLLLTKIASVREASPGDYVQYRLSVQNRGTRAATNLVMTDVLPTGLRYQRRSTHGADEPQVASDGRTLTFAMPTLAEGASAEIRYTVSIAPGAPQGEALNRASIRGGNAFSNEAAASVRLKPLLFSDAMTIIGRVTEGNCGDPIDHRRGVPGIRLLLDDGTFVVTDRDGLYHFEGVRPIRHVVQIDTASIPATHEAVACDADTRQAGSAISRFVEGDGGLLKRVDFQLRPTGKTVAAADPLPIVAMDDATAAGNRDWIAGQTPGIGWLFPAADYNPRTPALRVAIKHAPGQRVALTVDGHQVDPLSFDGTDDDAAKTLSVSRWSGIPLHTGDNRLDARVLDGSGAVVQSLQRVVHVSGAAARATLDAAKSRLVADGLTRPLLAVKVVDKDGRPVRAGTLVPFRVDQPYTAAIEAALEQGRQLAGRERTETTAVVVGDEGYAFLALQPTTVAGSVRAVVTMTEEKTVRTSEIRGWLAASVRDWTVVGFGAGTLGYQTLSRHGRSLPRESRDRVVTDGQLALYAKGRIKGQWLLTLAYDSDRAYDPDRGLLGVIDPDRYYTVYGDGSAQGYDAPTRRKLYLRLERRELYALFGDFETGFTDTQLTRYSRTLNGIKAAYEGRRVRAQAFAAKTDTLYARDEIQGNGLSGPYRLSGRNIVPNSDKLVIEVRDRFRSELIVSTVALTRHIDYDIDTRLGTIRFREPVLSRDAQQNPRFIVVDYEVEGGRTEKLAAAGRVVAKLAGGKVELGAAAIRDETAGSATVLGADVKARLGTATELRGEFATGGKYGIGRGKAFLAEADHHGGGLDLLAYLRQQDARFGVGQQNFVEQGTRKFGVDGRYQITNALSVTGTAWYQDMLDSAATRTAADVRVEYRRETGTVFLGAQYASDTGLDGGDRDSRLLTLGGSKSFFGGDLQLSGQTQVAPGGQKDSVDFPIRHQITASYRLTRGIRLIGGYEIADGKDFVAHTAQLGFDVAPWRGAKLMSTLNQQAVGENGARTYAQYGLSQSLPLGKRWSVDATLDAASTVRGAIKPGAVVNAFQPVASGGSLGGVGNGVETNADFTAVTLGATYRAARWSWNGRLEYRASDGTDRWGITSSFLRALGEGKTLASGIKAYTLTDRTGARASYASADVALALRPLDSRWSVLERLELRYEGADAGFTDSNVLGVPAYGAGTQVTTRAINNLALNYRTGPEGAGHGFEGTVYYGAKYVKGRFADDTFDGFIDVTGFELRRDLGRRLDVGVQGSVQHAWNTGTWSWSGGPSVGLSPAKNLWVSAGYNIAGYRDRDFEDDRYTRSGPYVTMRLKFDQTTIRSATRTLFGGRR